MAANPDKGEFEVTINGTTYLLASGTRAMIAWQRYFETKDGRPSIDDLFAALANGSVEHAAALWWSSFKKYHPEITYDTALTLMDDLGGLVVAQDLINAFRDVNTPDPEDVQELTEQADPLTAQPVGTGETSNSSPVAAG